MWGHKNTEQLLSGLKHGASFISGLQEARSRRAWQAYNNAMTRISAGQNMNAITTNENMAVERSVAQGFQIERSEYMTTAEVEVSAAAMGTVGRSVNQSLFQAERNGAVAQARRQSDLEAQLLGYDNQRRMTAFQTAQQIDHTYLPNPSLPAAMLGFSADLRNINSKYETYYRT